MIERKAKKIGDILGQIKRNKEKSELMFRDFEKNLGMKLKVMNEYEDKNDEGLNNPMLDLDIYQKRLQDTMKNIQKKHVDIVYSIRDKESETVSRVS
jgi:hypothetical protein